MTIFVFLIYFYKTFQYFFKNFIYLYLLIIIIIYLLSNLSLLCFHGSTTLMPKLRWVKLVNLMFIPPINNETVLFQKLLKFPQQKLHILATHLFEHNLFKYFLVIHTPVIIAYLFYLLTCLGYTRCTHLKPDMVLPVMLVIESQQTLWAKGPFLVPEGINTQLNILNRITQLTPSSHK